MAQKRLKSHRPSTRLVTGVAIGVGIIVFVAALVFIPERSVQHEKLSVAERLAAVATVRQLIALLGGGALAVIGIYYTHQRHVIDRRSNALQYDSNYTDRYTAAVAQLGSESLTIRMGGIYGLERVARDSTDDKDTVIAVLASFVRADATRAAAELGEWPQLGLLRFQAPLDVVAALSVVTRMGKAPTDVFDPPWLDLTGSHLGSVTLTHHHVVQGVDFSEAYLRGASLMFTNFDGSNLFLANLSNAAGTKASFVHSRMERTHLHMAHFPNADFSHAWMQDADLSYSMFSDAKFLGTIFLDADLSGSMLVGADVRDAVFAGAKLYRTNFSGAHNWNPDAFERAAAWDAKTVWPEGFTPSTVTKGPPEAASA
jgi:uncharacterized protein YjbI with pentapeptide repeats